MGANLGRFKHSLFHCPFLRPWGWTVEWLAHFVFSPPHLSTSLLPRNALVGYHYEAARCFNFRGKSCNSSRLFHSFILAFLKNRRPHPPGSLAAYSLLERGSVFCLEMAADKNTLHNNYSVEHISKVMEPWAYWELLASDTSTVTPVRGDRIGQSRDASRPTGSHNVLDFWRALTTS